MARPVTLTILRPGEEPELQTVELEAQPGLAALKTFLTPLLGTSSLENVRVLYNGLPTDMFVDECGALNGSPRNERATEIYRAWSLARNQGSDPETLPAIYGVAVLFSRQVWF